MTSRHSNINLTTTRINRLLRPLRNKCANLATLTSHSTSLHTAISTYLNKASGWSDQEAPPLALLQPPNRFVARTRLDENAVKFLDLSHAIYDVRDCFRNLTRAVLGIEGLGADYSGGVSLAAMCSRTIGQTIQAEFDTELASRVNKHENAMDEHEEMELAIEIYEAVPTHYRKWTIISNATSMILRMCPHHPTLLNALLDVCLSWNLIHETEVVLHALLEASILPPQDMHSNYARIHQFHGSNTRRCSTRDSFVRSLVRVLTTCRLPEAWTSKSVAKFVRETRENHFPSFVYLATGLAQSIGGLREKECAMGGKRVARLCKGDTAMRDRLNKWVISMIESTHEDSLDDLLHFLAQAQLFVLHVCRTVPAATEPELCDNILCLALSCLDALSNRPEHARDLAGVANLLAQASPITATFTELLRPSLCDDIQRHSNVCFAQLVQISRRYAALLRSHSLLRLEASLWACTLRFMEGQSSSEVSCCKEMTALKSEVIAAVDEVESRCFGSRTIGSSASLRSNRKRTGEEATVPEWEWEDIVGCWIQRSPVVKRPRLEAKQTRHIAPNLRKMNNPLRSTNPTPSTSLSISSRTSVRASCDSFADEYGDGGNSENQDTRADICNAGVRRRVSDFSCILANAQMNRMILHRKTQPKSQSHSRHKSFRLPRKMNRRDENNIPSVDDSAILASDDSLNLFDMNSSPVRNNKYR